MALLNSIKSIVGIVFITFLILAFATIFIQETNPDSEVLSSVYGLNSSRVQLNQSLSNFSNTVDKSFEELASSDPSPVDFLFLIFKGAFYIPWFFVTFIFQTITTLTAVLFPTLGGTGLGVIVTVGLSLLGSIVLIVFILGIVKAIRSGESER